MSQCIVSLRQKLLSPYLLMILPPLFWAGNAVVGRAAVGELPPIALAFWRWLFAFLLLLPIGLPRILAQKALVRRQWKVLCLLALFSVTAYNTFLYIALTTTTAINATLVSAAIPVAIVGVSWAWSGETVSWRQGSGILLSLAGVLLVIARGDIQALLSLSLHVGDLWALTAVASWAVFSVLLRRHPTGLDAFALLTVQVGLGLAFLSPLYLVELASGARMILTPHSLGLIAYVAVFPSAVAYGFWNRGVAELGASIAGQYTNLIPVFTAVLAALLLGESFHWFHSAGMLLIFAGIWLATRGGR